ncbi:MAG TPA: DUF4142 domain-containing protein [Sphingomonas sp.]|nr:DUF4142 domain-containing protein [Sphingomonas sp.]
MQTSVTISTVAAIGFALAACGQASRNESSASDNMVTANEVGSVDNNMATANGATAAPSAMTAAQFAATAAASDKYEIESSKLAESQASRTDVKDFASMLVKDHSNSTAELKSIASKEHIALSPPALDPAMQGKIDALKAAKGAQFDTLYLTQQVPAHETALKMMQDYAATGDNEAVKGFATKTSTVVQKHLDRARELSKQ